MLALRIRTSTSTLARAALLFAGFLLPQTGLADQTGHANATAELTRPASIGEIVDDDYIFSWLDLDDQVASEEATVDFYYTKQNPPTYALGEIPKNLEGTLIVAGIAVSDVENNYRWDTTSVPSGAYWIWSVVNDPLAAQPEKKNIYFSPGVVTIVHAGDQIPPAVVFMPLENPFRWPATNTLDIGYKAYDPDLSGTVRIYASRSQGGVDMTLISDDLPVGPNGHVLWDTSGLQEGEWTLKANITDARGFSFTAYDRNFRFVNTPESAESGGCSAVSLKREGGVESAALLLIGLVVIGRARRRAGRTGRR